MSARDGSAAAAVAAVERPRLLILSFSDVENDARVRRQVELFAGDYRVTTCGYGNAFRDDVEHLMIPEPGGRIPRYVESVGLRTRSFRLAYALMPEVRAVRRALRGREFDAALLNDLPAAGAVAGLVPYSRVLLDLHEYWPGLHDDVEAWRRLRLPFLQWMLREHASRAAARTTVNGVIADRYEREYGFASEVVVNAGLQQMLEPSEVEGPIRLVHSGGVNPGRRIDVMMRAVAASSRDLTLDLYLMSEGSGARRQLEALADELGERIRVLQPVRQAELVSTLNGYDVGIHVLAPTCTNNEVALPNKFFDFVQARLAIVTGPTPAMVELLERHGLGVVTEDFSEAAVTAAIDSLTPESVRGFKQHAARAAGELAGERQMQTWVRLIGELAAGGLGRGRPR